MSNRKTILTGLLLFLAPLIAPVSAHAGSLFGKTVTASSMTMNISGDLKIAGALSSSNTFTIQLIGSEGAIKASSGAFVYGVTAATFTATKAVSGFTGDLTGDVVGSVTGAASLNVLKSGDQMTGDLEISSSTLRIDGNASGAPSIKVGISTFIITDAGFVGIGIAAPETTFHLLGSASIDHTATAEDDHALRITMDADGVGNAKGISMFYKSGAIGAGTDNAAVLINMDETASTGGELFALEVLTTAEGSADVFAVKASVNVGLLVQESGTFGDVTRGLVIGTDRTTEFNSSASDIEMFTTNADSITVTGTMKFTAIEIIFNTVASNPGVKPDFFFSTGLDAWTEFFPVDGTDGMRENGSISWDLSDIPGWATGNNGEFLIAIVRTQGGLSTPPIEDKIQIAATIRFGWDKDGKIVISTMAGGTGLDMHIADSDDNEWFHLEFGGFVGMGTDAPAVKLHISSNTLLIDGNAAVAFQIGTSSLIVTSAGKVGIGTTDPLQLLDVRGTILSSGSAAGVLIHRGEDNGVLSFLRTDDNIILGIGLGDINWFGADRGVAQILAARIAALADGTWTDNTDAPTKLVFSTTPDGTTTLTERMVIDEAGNVGIGTTNPAVLFEVAGNLRAVDFQVADDIDLFSANAQIKFSAGDGEMVGNDSLIIGMDENNNQSGEIIRFMTDGRSVELMRIKEDGTVGVGTTAPLNSFDVATGSITFGAVGVVGCIMVRDTDNAGWSQGTLLDGVITWAADDGDGICD